jgi:hypothetical protein
MTTPAITTSDTSVAPHPRTEYILPLPHIPQAVSAVRHRARRILSHWALPTETADDAILVISELNHQRDCPRTAPSSTAAVDARGRRPSRPPYRGRGYWAATAPITREPAPCGT